MAVVLALVPGRTDPDTIRALRELLADAEKGLISGFAGVATYNGSEYAGFVTGYAKTRPILTRGMLDELKNEL